MPKRGTITLKNHGKRWMLNVAASLSESGNRERYFFDTREKAKAEKKRLEEANANPLKSSPIAPSLADDATRAKALLEPFGASLMDAARLYVKTHDRRAKSVALSAAWASSLARRERKMAEGKRGGRPRTVGEFKRWGQLWPDWIAGKLVCDIEGRDIEKALSEITGSDVNWNKGYRLIRACLNEAIKEGWLSKNPCRAVWTKDTHSKPPEILKPVGQAEAVFEAVRDLYPESERAPVAFALLMFAGLRPDELKRLTWDDISLENRNIRVPGQKSKTHTLRNVHVEDNLMAWLKSLKAETWKGRRHFRKSQGWNMAVVPRDWKRKVQAVRKATGISDEQDIFRHSYGSYHLAAFNDLGALQSNMGHSSVRIYFDFYHRALTKREALPYWQIAPEGVEIRTIIEAA